MNISLPPEREQWLKQQIDQGVFAYVEDAVRKLIAEHMAFEPDDFAWARSYVDEARAAVARGDVLTLEEAAGRRNATRDASFQTSTTRPARAAQHHAEAST